MSTVKSIILIVHLHKTTAIILYAMQGSPRYIKWKQQSAEPCVSQVTICVEGGETRIWTVFTFMCSKNPFKDFIKLILMASPLWGGGSWIDRAGRKGRIPVLLLWLWREGIPLWKIQVHFLVHLPTTPRAPWIQGPLAPSLGCRHSTELKA